MEGRAKHVVTQESEWGCFGSAGTVFPRHSAVQCAGTVFPRHSAVQCAGTVFPRHSAVQCDSGSGDKPALIHRHGLAGGTSVGEKARAAWTAIASRHRGPEPSDGKQHGVSWSHRDLPAKTAQEIMWELLQDPTFDGSYLVHLLLENVQSKFGPPKTEAPTAGNKPTCKFCRNNNEEDIHHQFKNASGLVVCPVLSKHVCDLCGVSGPFAHTRKYCPKNPLTLGLPEEGGFPPGMLPKDVYETTQMMLQMMNSRKKPM